jgi:hypothetical protein
MSEGVGGSVGADLAAIERLVAEMARRLDDQQSLDSTRIRLNHVRAEVSRLGQQLREARENIADELRRGGYSQAAWHITGRAQASEEF